MTNKQRLVIFQIGSLGDTVISLPCFREIARRHPDAERYLLTNLPVGRKMVQAEALLAPCGLIHGCVEYPWPLRGARNIFDLYQRLRALKIDVLYYLAPETRLLNLVRHYAFFKACGIGAVYAMPWTRDLRLPRQIVPGKLWESEASRLLRNIGAQREAAPPVSADRSLDLTEVERGTAHHLLSEVPGLKRFIAVSVGGKLPINDWGNRNWATVLSMICATNPDLGVVFIGSRDERERNDLLADSWTGPKLNSCGRLTPRETAALIERADLFLGHDTGTLHLAAAVGTRIVGVYSARNVPGKWFSERSTDRLFYNQVPCFGCELEKPADCQNGMVCMTMHRTSEIADAASQHYHESRFAKSFVEGQDGTNGRATLKLEDRF
jgi:heptosyltransferase-3